MVGLEGQLEPGGTQLAAAPKATIALLGQAVHADWIGGNGLCTNRVRWTVCLHVHHFFSRKQWDPERALPIGCYTKYGGRFLCRERGVVEI